MNTTRRDWTVSAAATAAGALLMPGMPAAAPPPGGRVVTGAAAAAASGFASLRGRRVALISNQTGRVGSEHLADLLGRADSVKLAAILAPEHGFRGGVEAGDKVSDSRDARTGAPVFSLYGKTRKPSPEMLRGVDCLLFDIQDVGVRFYTYISTMGLAMQAAAERRVPFVVLDRPNPLGGAYVSGFVMEPRFKSFVGQYPIPIVHGLTVGELARMIRDEGWLPGLDRLELEVIRMQGWQRAMRWPATGLDWVATSPNVPTFEAALAYPGVGIVGETLVNEGRGTPTPFSLFGAPWLDGRGAARRLQAAGLPGVRFDAISYTPRGIANVAAHPRFEGQAISGVRLTITDDASFRPLETGIHALATLRDSARAGGVSLLAGRDMFDKIAGTRRLGDMLAGAATATAIIAAWQDEAARFAEQRHKYLIY